MWTFDIQKPTDEDWTVYDAVGGGFNIAKEGNVKITPRSDKHARIVREEWAAAQKTGLHYKPAPREVFSKYT
jgi:hypothetical protein